MGSTVYLLGVNAVVVLKGVEQEAQYGTYGILTMTSDTPAQLTITPSTLNGIISSLDLSEPTSVPLTVSPFVR
jgi:hypothetical protein